MKKKPKYLQFCSTVLAFAMLLWSFDGLLPLSASAASSSEIRKQINALVEEKNGIQKQIEKVQAQYQENEDEIADIVARKNVIDQEIQLLYTQIHNINERISAYNTLIADTQDELDELQNRYDALAKANAVRVQEMEESRDISYWDVLFKANSFTDLLDKLEMIDEISESDQKRLKELGRAAAQVTAVKDVLNVEKEEVERTRAELNDTEAEIEAKRAEADALILELLEKGADLEALEAKYQQQKDDFLAEIAQLELDYSAAKQAEWEAYIATYVAPTTQPQESSTASSTAAATTSSEATASSGSSTSSGTSNATWLVPVSYNKLTSPFGLRESPTTGASTYHQGVDLSAPAGTPIKASRAGVVVIAGYSSSAGNYVKIDHQDGFASIYMHMTAYSVSKGQTVSAGQQIGTVGMTGVATGNHLHFGILYNGAYVNPCSYVALY